MSRSILALFCLLIVMRMTIFHARSEEVITIDPMNDLDIVTMGPRSPNEIEELKRIHSRMMEEYLARGREDNNICGGKEFFPSADGQKCFVVHDNFEKAPKWYKAREICQVLYKADLPTALSKEENDELIGIVNAYKQNIWLRLFRTGPGPSDFVWYVFA